MEKPDRRIIWLHVTFLKDGDIEQTFVIERWKDGHYLHKRRRTSKFSRLELQRVGQLMTLARSHKDARYILPAYDGWSICFEKLFY